jgi:hypothetical protein
VAAPVDSARQGTNITSAGTSHAINVGSPAAGTGLIVVVRFAGDPGTVTFTGYLEIALASNDASDDDMRIFTRVANGSEGATDTLTTTNSVKAAAICWEITGYGTSSGFMEVAVANPVTFTTAANSANPPQVPATPGLTKQFLFLVVAGQDGEVGAYTAAPTNYTSPGLVTANSGTGGSASSNCYMGGASRQLTATSDDAGVFTHGAATTGGMAWALAVYPLSTSKTLTHAGSPGSSETDTAVALIIAAPSDYDILPAATTNTAVALAYGSAFSISPVTETDWTNSIVSLQPFPAAETDTTFTRTRNFARSITTAAETDSAVALTYSQASDYDITFAAETDTAVALSVAQSADYDITTATEIDAAQALTQASGITIAAATETDLTNSIVPLRVFPATETDAAVAVTISAGTYYDIVTVAETDAAQPLTRSKLVTIATATETDAAQALTFAQASDYDITLVSETDLANSIVPLRVFPASETDSAQTVSVSGGAYSITHAAETDSAQARTASKSVTLPEYEATPPLPYNTITIGDTSTAIALSIAGAQSVNISPALETDAPQAVTYAQASDYDLTFATETDSAQALTYSQAGAYSLAPALEADTAGTLRAPNLTTAAETDTTVAVTFTKTIYKTLVAATETDSAQPVTYSQSADYSLAPGGETDSAGSLRVPRLLRAAETDLALSVTYSQAGAYSIAPALETDSVQTLVVPQTVSITTAGDTSAAVAITSSTAVNLIPAVETSSGVALTVHKTVTLGHAAETDQAVGIPYGGAYDILTASETDTATALLYAAMPPSGRIQTIPLGRISRTRTGRINRTKQGVIA